MSKKEKNIIGPADLTGECRILLKSGMKITGTVTGYFDNALLVEDISKETMVVFLDAIAAFVSGLVPPKLQQLADEVKGEKEGS